MSLDVTISGGNGKLYKNNITHNLNRMAEAAGIYKHLWRPEEIGVTKAGQLVDPLRAALADMCERQSHYKEFDSKNGWGLYVNFLPWIAEYLEACIENPDGNISVDR